MSFRRTASLICITAIAVLYISSLLKPKLSPHVDGYTDSRFAAVMDVFRENVESGLERGAAFAVYYKGKLVVDVWGGYADPAAKAKWRKDTVAMVFSTTKGVAAIVVAKMVEQGILDYKKLISHYWPEFGCNGKENTTVEMLMSHTAGVPSISESIPVRWLNDELDKVSQILAETTPEWPPGTALGYHSLTYGHFVDTLVRKADPRHRSMGQIYIDEIGKPFDIPFHFGMPLADTYKASRMFTADYHGIFQLIVNPKYWKMHGRMFVFNSTGSRGVRAVKEAADFNQFNDPYLREVGVSSFTGHSTARDLAKLYSILANGGEVGGKQLLSKKMIKRLNTPVSSGMCRTLGINGSFSVGMAMSLKSPSGEVIMGHPGFGGQVAYAEFGQKLGVSYITNHLDIFSLNDDPRFIKLQTTLYKILENIKD